MRTETHESKIHYNQTNSWWSKYAWIDLFTLEKKDVRWELSEKYSTSRIINPEYRENLRGNIKERTGSTINKFFRNIPDIYGVIFIPRK